MSSSNTADTSPAAHKAYKMSAISQKMGLVATIREYVAAQVDLWRRIPWLEFQNDGKHGYSDSRPMAYRYGYLHVDRTGGAANMGSPMIDCATGELVVFWSFGEGPPEQLSTDAVMVLANRLDSLDAAARIAALEVGADDDPSDHIDRNAYDEWRRRTIETYGVKEVFEPQNPRRYPNFQFSID